MPSLMWEKEKDHCMGTNCVGVCVGEHGVADITWASFGRGLTEAFPGINKEESVQTYVKTYHRL